MKKGRQIFPEHLRKGLFPQGQTLDTIALEPKEYFCNELFTTQEGQMVTCEEDNFRLLKITR